MTKTLAISVAEKFIELSIKDNELITPIKLYKLVYMAHGWSLGLRNKPLFIDRIQAGKFGPIIKSIERSYEKYGNTEISAPVEPEEYTVVPTLDEDESALVCAVWNKFKDFSAAQLSTLTHKEGTPWEKVWNYKNGKNSIPYMTIDDGLIKECYDKVISQNAS
jgi:uncharacterized phage-associated protein